jgi:hypothetical protein
MTGMPKKAKASARDYFAAESNKFCLLERRAVLISNSVGRRAANPRCYMATWLFMRACVTAQSMVQLFDPPLAGFGKSRYLDHASIAALSRCMIENVTVFLYIGDNAPSDDEWACRSQVIDLHDFCNRREFLSLLNIPKKKDESDEMTFEFLTMKLRENPFFKTLKPHRQKILLRGEDMFIEGRSVAIRQIGWGDEHARGIYKYLSNHAHSMPMAFHRTEINKVYEKDSEAAKGVAALSIEHARRAFGVACLRMFSLFPDVGASYDPLITAELKADYGGHD